MRGRSRRVLAVLIPIVIGLLVAAGVGTARQGAHTRVADKPKPSKDPPKAVKHGETMGPLSSLDSKPPKHRDDKEQDKIPVPPKSGLPDTVEQTSIVQTSSPTLDLTFDGLSANGSLPPDPNGAAGPNNFVEIVNQSIAVYNKTGTKITSKTTNTLWTGFGGGCENNDDGDGTVAYDRLADRWVISQFSVSTTPYLQCVAVSKTGNPAGAYWLYAFQYNDFPDYPKLGVWPDGYYITFNLFDDIFGFFIGPEVCAYDRATMLAGGSSPSQHCYTLSPQYGGMLPSDLDGPTSPPSGSPNILLNFDTDSLDVWKFAVNWAGSGTGELTGPTVLPVAAFTPACGDGGACIPQPSTSSSVKTKDGGEKGGGGGGTGTPAPALDSLGDRLMYRLAYRNFGDHESWVVNHSVQAGSSNNTVGIRWYELRKTPASASGTPSVYQQGTYTPNSEFRWMGSIAMSGAGDIALGYSRSSSASGDYPSIYVTGRLAGDPLGQMTQGENLLFKGQGVQTSYSRWGDYTSMSVDPSDDCTFWYTNQYQPSGANAFNWKTRIGVFRLPGCSGAGSGGGGGGGGGASALVNGDFENGLTGWNASGTPAPSIVSSPVHGGSKAVLLGSKSKTPPKGESKLKQTVTVPSGSPHLTFWYQPKCAGADQMKMLIQSTGGATLATVLNGCQSAGSYQQVSFDMTPFAGQTVVLYFGDKDDGKKGQASSFYLDDVALS